MSKLGVIPARYGSFRFPGKPLQMLHGQPLVVHVYQRAMECDFDEVVIATDDDRIRTACEAFGCVVMMTSSDHINGTDRVAEVAQRRSADIVFNIQGDEPLIEPALITLLMNVMEWYRG